MEAILNQYIHKHIPITTALGASVSYASAEKVIVSAPFLNNINHQSTVFGGSLHALSTLACWGLLYANFINQLGDIDIVIQHSDIEYIKPVTNDFEAVCLKPTDQWTQFEKMFQRKAKARIEIAATIHENEALAVDFKGIFVVIKR